jgi:hypothetical protein
MRAPSKKLLDCKCLINEVIAALCEYVDVRFCRIESLSCNDVVDHRRQVVAGSKLRSLRGPKSRQNILEAIMV